MSFFCLSDKERTHKDTDTKEAQETMIDEQ